MSYGPHKQKRKCESAHGGMRYCIFPPHHGSCFPNRQRHQLSESMAIQSVLKTQRYKNTDAPDTTTQPKQAVQDTGSIHGLIFHFFARADFVFVSSFARWSFSGDSKNVSIAFLSLKLEKQRAGRDTNAWLSTGDCEYEYQYQSTAPGLWVLLVPWASSSYSG